MPDALSAHDLNLAQRLVERTWHTKSNGFDLDHWSKVVFRDAAHEAKELRLYQEARREHAVLLRMEGLKLKQIAERLGVTSVEQARVLIAQFARRMQKATRRTRMYFPEDPLRTRRAERQLRWFNAKQEAETILRL